MIARRLFCQCFPARIVAGPFKLVGDSEKAVLSVFTSRLVVGLFKLVGDSEKAVLSVFTRKVSSWSL